MNQHAGTGATPSPFLTYEPFYGLREKPFRLASDPAFFYKSAGHRAAFDALSTGIRRREGLIVLSGGIGTGKTTLCRAVLSQLDRKTFSTFVPDPFVTREDLLKTMLVGFGIVSVADLNGGRLHGASRQDLSYPLYEFLDSLVPLQAFAVLVIDEAQNLSLGVMEEIRILAELEQREKLLQVVLVGQPELRDNLRLPQMRQVEQRVTVRCNLAPLAFREVAEYVGHRLTVAADAAPTGVEFTAGALEAVHLASGGVPRLINLVCDRSLQRGFESRLQTIDRETVNAAVRDLGLGDREPPSGTIDLSDVLPLPFEADPDTTAPPPVPQASSAAPAPPRPAPVSAAVSSLVETSTRTSTRPGADPLNEFDREPDASSPPPPAAPMLMSPPAESVDAPRRILTLVLRALGLTSAVLGVAIGAGVLDTRAAVDTVVPAATPALPPAPDRRGALTALELRAPDALAAALSDGRAHEPDAYSVRVASFHDHSAAERLVAELTTGGFRSRWVETRSDVYADQQVYVDGYGTLEEALAMVTRLRQRPGGSSAGLFRVPGALRQP